MTELMLRLIKDNEIVGYMWIGDFNTGDGLRIRYKQIGEPNGYTHPIKSVNFDSFELGIKIGNEWIFDGDILEVELEEFYGGGITTAEFIYNKEHGCFMINPKDGTLPGIFVIKEDYLETAKVIGNIHEAGE